MPNSAELIKGEATAVRHAGAPTVLVSGYQREEIDREPPYAALRNEMAQLRQQDVSRHEQSRDPVSFRLFVPQRMKFYGRCLHIDFFIGYSSHS